MKRERKDASIIARSLRRRRPKPVEIDLTVQFKFGDRPDDTVTVLDDRRVPLVGGVFEQRNRILKAFARLMVKGGVAQPRVLAELIPALRLFRRK